MDKIEQAKAILREAGFFVDNLWHIDDVKNNHECTDDEAYDILEQALTSDWITEQIFSEIDDTTKI
jgi:hypothetical protein